MPAGSHLAWKGPTGLMVMVKGDAGGEKGEQAQQEKRKDAFGAEG